MMLLLKTQIMTRLELEAQGVKYVRTCWTGTEVFITKDGAEVRSYDTGYVRRSETTIDRYGDKRTIVYQLNIKETNKVMETRFDTHTGVKYEVESSLSRILLDTKEARYDRIADWNKNRNLRAITKKSDQVKQAELDLSKAQKALDRLLRY